MNSNTGVRKNHTGLKIKMGLGALLVISMIALFGWLPFAIIFAILTGAYDLPWIVSLGILCGIVGGIVWYTVKRHTALVKKDATELTRQTAPELSDTFDFLEERSQALGMDTPTILVRPGNVNAFAIGGRKNGYIILQEGALAVFSKDELHAILGHEMAHLHNRDSYIQQTISFIESIIIRFWTGVGYTLNLWWYENRGVVLGPTDRAYLKEKMRRRARYLTIPIAIFENMFSRQREYLADTYGAELQNPQSMVSALQKLEQHPNQPNNETVPAQLHIIGWEESYLSRLLSTHPRTEKRISFIEREYFTGDEHNYSNDNSTAENVGDNPGQQTRTAQNGPKSTQKSTGQQNSGTSVNSTTQTGPGTSNYADHADRSPEIPQNKAVGSGSENHRPQQPSSNNPSARTDTPADQSPTHTPSQTNTNASPTDKDSISEPTPETNIANRTADESGEKKPRETDGVKSAESDDKSTDVTAKEPKQQTVNYTKEYYNTRVTEAGTSHSVENGSTPCSRCGSPITEGVRKCPHCGSQSP